MATNDRPKCTQGRTFWQAVIVIYCQLTPVLRRPVELAVQSGRRWILALEGLSDNDPKTTLWLSLTWNNPLASPPCKNRH